MTPLSWITIGIWHQLYPKVATSYCFKTREFCSIIAIVQSCVEQLIERCGYELYRVKVWRHVKPLQHLWWTVRPDGSTHIATAESTLCKRDMR